MPSAMEMMASVAKPGCFRSWRKPKRISCRSVSISARASTLSDAARARFGFRKFATRELPRPGHLHFRRGVLCGASARHLSFVRLAQQDVVPLTGHSAPPMRNETSQAALILWRFNSCTSQKSVSRTHSPRDSTDVASARPPRSSVRALARGANDTRASLCAR